MYEKSSCLASAYAWYLAIKFVSICQCINFPRGVQSGHSARGCTRTSNRSLYPAPDSCTSSESTWSEQVDCETVVNHGPRCVQLTSVHRCTAILGIVTVDRSSTFVARVSGLSSGQLLAFLFLSVPRQCGRSRLVDSRYSLRRNSRPRNGARAQQRSRALARRCTRCVTS